MATKKGAGATKQGAPLEPKVADRLLELLSTDNEFRRLFKKDPQAALVKAGWKPPAVARVPGVAKPRKPPPFSPPGPPPVVPPVGRCMTVTNIAPKEEIARARDALRTYLTSMAGYTTPHAFEAGKVMTAIRRK